jgi:hypothetical protein
MKILLFTILFLCSSAFADQSIENSSVYSQQLPDKDSLPEIESVNEFNFREYYKWSDADTNREYAFLALNVIDWRQTIYIARNPYDYSEANPFFSSSHPSESEVNFFFASTTIMHPLISMALTPEYRKYWQYFTITFTGLAVANNARLGIKFEF